MLQQISMTFRRLLRNIMKTFIQKQLENLGEMNLEINSQTYMTKVKIREYK